MRSFTIAVMVTIVLATACVGNVYAVGLYAVGKEQCNCSPLVARGIIPDPLNKLKEALVCSQLAQVLDKIVVELKGMVAQVGAPSVGAYEEATKEEEIQGIKEKPTLEKKPGKEEGPAKEEKPAIEKKSIKGKKPALQLKKDETKKKKRRVKIPPKVT